MVGTFGRDRDVRALHTKPCRLRSQDRGYIGVMFFILPLHMTPNMTKCGKYITSDLVMPYAKPRPNNDLEVICLRPELSLHRTNSSGKNTRTVPRHPACTIPTARFALSYRNTGAQSEVMMPRHTPAWSVISASVRGNLLLKFFTTPTPVP